MNRAMNPYLHSVRYRSLMHGSEEEYDMFEDFAICRARNRRMNGAADSRLQFELPTSKEDCNTTPETTQHTTRGDEHLAPEDSSCAQNGKRRQEKDNKCANTLNLTAEEKEVKASNAPAGHGPPVDGQVCTQAESFQPDSSTPSNSAGTELTLIVVCY